MSYEIVLVTDSDLTWGDYLRVLNKKAIQRDFADEWSGKVEAKKVDAQIESISNDRSDKHLPMFGSLALVGAFPNEIATAADSLMGSLTWVASTLGEEFYGVFSGQEIVEVPFTSVEFFGSLFDIVPGFSWGALTIIGGIGVGASAIKLIVTQVRKRQIARNTALSPEDIGVLYQQRRKRMSADDLEEVRKLAKRRIKGAQKGILEVDASADAERIVRAAIHLGDVSRRNGDTSATLEQSGFTLNYSDKTSFGMVTITRQKALKAAPAPVKPKMREMLAPARPAPSERKPAVLVTDASRLVDSLVAELADLAPLTRHQDAEWIVLSTNRITSLRAHAEITDDLATRGIERKRVRQRMRELRRQVIELRGAAEHLINAELDGKDRELAAHGTFIADRYGNRHTPHTARTRPIEPGSYSS